MPMVLGGGKPRFVQELHLSSRANLRIFRENATDWEPEQKAFRDDLFPAPVIDRLGYSRMDKENERTRNILFKDCMREV